MRHYAQLFKEYPMSIQSFKNDDTEDLYQTGKSRPFGNILTVALRKLDMLHSAAALKDLRSPPGNHLKPLSDDRAGQHSIRINDQWRICFVWTPAGPENVEIVDYH
jgi:proteic killer suppression protein